MNDLVQKTSTLIQSSVLSLIIALLSSTAYAADLSPFELEVIQPRPALDENNRYYRAYPGIEYNVDINVVGGRYPYKYELTQKPTGMVINSDTGEVSWSAPEENNNAYAVQIKVTDSEGTQQNVSWTIKVTKEKFLFVDAVNGTIGAPGTLENPMKTFEDVYGGLDYTAKNAITNQHNFVYFRGPSDPSDSSHTYIPQGFTAGKPGVQWTYRHPAVLMAYPGENPRFDFSNTYFFGDTVLDNFYIEGFNITQISSVSQPGQYHFAFRIPGNSSNVTFRRNSFNNLATSTGSYNQSVIMMTSSSSRGKDWAIVNNEFANLQHAYGVLGYTVENVLIANNYIHDTSDPEGTGSSHAIGPKVDCTKWFIRKNVLKNIGNSGIWLYYASKLDGQEFGNMEVSYNYVEGNTPLTVNDKWAAAELPSHFFRNTFVGKVNFDYVNSGTGPFFLSKNVIINDPSNHVKCTSCDAPERIIQDSNLTGDNSSNIVNEFGNLTDGFSQYIGLIGWQTNLITSQPLAPFLIVKQ